MKAEEITVREVPLNEEVMAELLAMSGDWAQENNVYGYIANGRDDIEGNRIFLACDGEKTVGYAFGNGYASKNMRSIMEEGTGCFEVEELYVIPEYRSRGVGRKLMNTVSETVKGEYEYLTLSTATKNEKAILHFYLDEVGMTFWSARLFKKL